MIVSILYEINQFLFNFLINKKWNILVVNFSIEKHEIVFESKSINQSKTIYLKKKIKFGQDFWLKNWIAWFCFINLGK